MCHLELLHDSLLKSRSLKLMVSTPKISAFSIPPQKLPHAHVHMSIYIYICIYIYINIHKCAYTPYIHDIWLSFCHDITFKKVDPRKHTSSKMEKSNHLEDVSPMKNVVIFPSCHLASLQVENPPRCPLIQLWPVSPWD